MVFCLRVIFFLLLSSYIPLLPQDYPDAMTEDAALYDEYDSEPDTFEQDRSEQDTIDVPIVPDKGIIDIPPMVQNAPSIEQHLPAVPTQEDTGSIIDSVLEDQELAEPEGIHTVDINEPEGNWLFKRIWWEKSKDLFGKIRERVDQIVESRMHFFEERVKLDRDRLDPFYVTVGFDQGELTELVNHMLDLLKTERADVGTLGQRELEQYTILTEEKTTLEKLRLAVIDVRKLSNGFDDALKNLMDQINRARSYEREAWQLLNAIAEELSDKKAREHYYEIATIWRNIKEIGNYIMGPFSKHFVELGVTSVQRIEEIQTTLNALKKRGIEIGKQIEHEHEASCHKHTDEDEDDLEEHVVKVGWLTWFWHKITAPFSWTWHKITGLFGW